MRCGLHYVRFCDLRTKRCAAAPANQAAAKAIADALAGGPLTRRKAHAFAKHPSGSRPGASGARLPSDVVVLDPNAPRPAGPACLRTQGNDPSQGAVAPDGGPRHALPAGDPGFRDGSEPHKQPRSLRQGENETDRGARGGGPRPPGVAPAERSLGGQDPTAARDREIHTPQDVAHSQVSPIETRQEGECGGGPRDVRSLLGLGPGAGAPMGPGRPPPMAGSEGGPVRPKAKRAPQKPAQHRARKTKRLPEPSGDPRGHIQRWLVPGAAAGHTYQESCPPSVREPAQHPPARPGPRTGCSMEP